jgi:hypothetical protein
LRLRWLHPKPRTDPDHGSSRGSNIYGEDPLETLALATRFAQVYLVDREGLDPPVAPPIHYQKEPPASPDAEPPDVR